MLKANFSSFSAPSTFVYAAQLMIKSTSLNIDNFGFVISTCFLFLKFKLKSNSDEIFLGIQKIENKFLVNKINSNRFANIYYPDLE